MIESSIVLMVQHYTVTYCKSRFVSCITNISTGSKMLFQSRGTKKAADYLVLRAHADSPQQPPLLFAEDAVNLPHWWEVQLIWWPITVKGVSLVITQAAADHFNTKSKFKAALPGCQSI